jgi:acetylornithine deacetylase/succinyl-diaminopimelate desuccinylase-like protein
MADPRTVRYLEKHREQHIGMIQELVAQPSVSTEAKGGPEYAALLRDQYEAIGCQEAHVVDVGDEFPGVWAYLDAGAPHTIACYSYFDTYGVNEPDWEHPPFGATRTAYAGFPEVVVGRGATVKASHRLWMDALEAMVATDDLLPFNVLFLTEGAEMLGSPNYDAICDAASAYLPAVDAFLSPRSGESPSSNEISVVLGYKNMVTFDLVCRASQWGRGPVGGTVYGNSKSVVDAPTHRLVQAVASLLGSDGNRIAIDGLADLDGRDVELSDSERELVEGLLSRFGGGPWAGVLPTTAGVERWVDDLGGADLLRAYLYGPSINISEIRSAGIGDSPRLTMLLPDSASASVELRLVTDLPASEVLERVRRHLRVKGFPEVELIPAGVWEGQRTSLDEGIVQGALATLEAYGKSPVIWPIQPFGGPWAGIPQRLDIPSLSGCGLGYGANGGGAANEYFVIEGNDTVAGLVEAETYLVDLVTNVGARLSGEAEIVQPAVDAD